MFFCFPNHFHSLLWVVFLDNVHFRSSCLFGDYPLAAGMGSICQPCNLLRYMMFWRTSVCQIICTELQPKSCHLFVCVFWKLTESCASWDQGDWGSLILCYHSLNGEAIKSSMGATSCSPALHFEAFYLEMNRRPLPYEGREEKILLKAEDVGVCAI